MAYLDNTTGALSGVLPAPHDGVSIRILALQDRIQLTYRGTLDALVAAGAIDGRSVEHLAETDTGRDAHERPFSSEHFADGTFAITRHFGSLKNAADLPGVAGRSIGVDAVLPQKRKMRLVVSRP